MNHHKHSYAFCSCAKCLEYIRLGDSLGDPLGYTATTRKLHNAAIRQQEREQAMKDCGLTKVHGALGGVYWE